MTDDLSAGDDEPGAADNALDLLVADLHRKGLGRNSISRELSISTRQVDQSAARQGLTFDAQRTAAATAVRVANAGDARRSLQARFRSVADMALNQVEMAADSGHPVMDPDEFYRWLKLAAVSSDKDIAYQDLAARHQDNDAMANAVDALDGLGRLIRDTAAQNQSMKQAAQDYREKSAALGQAGDREPGDATPEDLGAPPLFNPEDDQPP